MLIFLICLNVLTLGIFLVLYDKKEEELYFIGIITSILAGIALFILIIVLICCGPDARREAKQLNIDCANLNYYVHHLEDYKERTLVEAINRYNVELKDFRAKQSSPWLNWFYPGDISECEYIIWVN